MNGKLQMAMFPQKSEWVPPAELPDITEAKQIAIDVETRDPNLKVHGPGWARGDGEVVGYAVAVDGWKCYLPVAHFGGGNLDKRITNKWLKKVFECPADKIMHNAQYDLGWIRRMGFDVKGRIIDTMVAGNLLDENRFSYSLNALCYEYLGKTKSEKTLVEAACDFGVDPKGEMWKLPAMYVGPYAETDAEITLELWNHFKPLLAREELTTVWDLEMSLLPCLVDMTMKGVRVDVDKAERTKQQLRKEEIVVKKRIKELVGFDVEIWAAESVAKAFEKLSVPFPRTEKGAPSFTKDFINGHDHELPQLVAKARNINKTSGTFIDSILKHVKNGRIHSHINQIRSDDGGTVSGRISMNNPNLQQIPARDPVYGPMIRGLFLPEEGQKWASIDFSQQEPRILVHYAKAYGDSRNQPLKGVDEFVNAYINNPDMDFHSMVSEMAEIPRKQAKTINLGMIYGMGVNKLAEQLGISKDEAKALTAQYHERVPFVRGLSQAIQRHLEHPRSSGRLRSLCGRACRFDMWEPVSYEMHKAMSKEDAIAAHGPTVPLRRAFTYKAMNRLIQASAADMTKKSMVEVFQKEGITPLIQVHDELVFSVESEEQARRYAKIMENALPLFVPSKCDIEIGSNWGDIEEVDS